MMGIFVAMRTGWKNKIGRHVIVCPNQNNTIRKMVGDIWKNLAATERKGTR
jgi:hypothetical protein